MRAPLLLVLAALAAGCTLPPSPAPVEAARVDEPPAAAAEPTFQRAAPPPAAPRVDVRMAVEDRWVRPHEDVLAEAVSPRATSFEWYLASRNPIRERPDLVLGVPPGGSRSLVLDAPGRYVLDVGGAPVNVSVVPGEPGLGVLVVASGGAAGPDESSAAPGSRFTLRNEGREAVVARLVERLPLVALGQRVAFPMPPGLELGDYDLVVVARAGPAVGADAARLVYDKRKPDEAWEAGPWRGRFQAAATSAPERYAWTASHDARNVTVAVSAASDAPLPADLRVALVDAVGGLVAEGGPPGFAVAALPRGEYGLVLTLADGALVSYEASMTGEWVLVPPASFFAS